MAGASQIVAVDLIDAKLDVACLLGATSAINVQCVRRWTRCVPRFLMAWTSSSMRSARSSPPSKRLQSLGMGGAAVVVGLPPNGETGHL